MKKYIFYWAFPILGESSTYGQTIVYLDKLTQETIQEVIDSLSIHSSLKITGIALLDED